MLPREEGRSRREMMNWHEVALMWWGFCAGGVVTLLGVMALQLYIEDDWGE